MISFSLTFWGGTAATQVEVEDNSLLEPVALTFTTTEPSPHSWFILAPFQQQMKYRYFPASLPFFFFSILPFFLSPSSPLSLIFCKKSDMNINKLWFSSNYIKFFIGQDIGKPKLCIVGRNIWYCLELYASTHLQ